MKTVPRSQNAPEKLERMERMKRRQYVDQITPQFVANELVRKPKGRTDHLRSEDQFGRQLKKTAFANLSSVTLKNLLKIAVVSRSLLSNPDWFFTWCGVVWCVCVCVWGREGRRAGRAVRRRGEGEVCDCVCKQMCGRVRALL